jgi:hypothetical protein
VANVDFRPKPCCPERSGNQETHVLNYCPRIVRLFFGFQPSLALHEFQAYLSDHYHLALDWWRDEKPEPFEGTWNLFAREFDPSQPLHDLRDEETLNPTIQSQNKRHGGINIQTHLQTTD